MDLNLAGKKVILTGGSRGIGLAIATALAKEGADLAFLSRDVAQVAEASRAIEVFGGRVYGDAVDMTDHGAYRDWLASTAERLGGADIFIHNASASGSPDTASWQRCFDIDMMGAVIGFEVLQPHLERAGNSSVVFMTSTGATETFLAPNGFSAMKAGLVVFGKQLSQAWAHVGIRVNMVCPGPIEFPDGNWAQIKSQTPEFYSSVQEKIPTGRLGSAEEVANAVLFLASDAARYITGINMVVDGGFTKRVQL